MLNLRRFVSVTSLFSLLALGTSAVAFASPAAPVTPEAGTSAAGAPHRGHHGRGDLIHASLRLESLSSSQRDQIHALLQQERAAHANIGAARSQLLQAVAGGLASGNVDNAALEPSVQGLEGAIEADEPGDRAAVEKLHAILTPAQRTELVARMESHRGHQPRPNKMGRGGMWGRDLSLTDAQKQQIRANLRAEGPAVDRALWTEARDTHQQVLEAFKGDSFVMSQVAPPRDPRLVEAEADRVVRMAKASAPVLTAEQRATAAAKLRTMAARTISR